MYRRRQCLCSKAKVSCTSQGFVREGWGLNVSKHAWDPLCQSGFAFRSKMSKISKDKLHDSNRNTMQDEGVLQ